MLGRSVLVAHFVSVSVMLPKTFVAYISISGKSCRRLSIALDADSKYAGLFVMMADMLSYTCGTMR